jgi:hypothetical protein
MIRAKHIAKILTLLAVILLLAGPRYAHAQNSSAYPYIDSWHLYRIAMDDITNDVVWTLSNTNATPSSYTLTTQSWVNIYTVDDATDSACVEIKFISSIFDGVTGDWTLTYSESDNDSGDDCISVAVRSFAIAPVTNDFYLTMGVDVSNCNSLDGEVLNWDDIDGLGLGHSGTVTTISNYVEITVQMHKASTFVMNTWSFNGEVTQLDGNYTFDEVLSDDDLLTGTSNLGMTYTITAGTGSTFSVIVNGPADPADPAVEDDYITLRAYVSGLVFESESVQVEISDGEATSGINYTSVTEDNEDLNDDMIQVITILPLPETPNISLID